MHDIAGLDFLLKHLLKSHWSKHYLLPWKPFESIADWYIHHYDSLIPWPRVVYQLVIWAYQPSPYFNDH